MVIFNDKFMCPFVLKAILLSVATGELWLIRWRRSVYEGRTSLNLLEMTSNQNLYVLSDSFLIPS